MNKINFDTIKPDFESHGFKWYIEKELQHLIDNEQAPNLPVLKGLGCFVVIGKDSEEYVLIDNTQTVLKSYPYSFAGYEQMETIIKMYKIAKHFKDHEKCNI